MMDAEMGDAGEGLVDAESRIQERLEDLDRARRGRNGRAVRNPETIRTLESLKLARKELESQLAATSHERRRAQINAAMGELDRRIGDLQLELTT
jgi:hypothetical protein